LQSIDRETGEILSITTGGLYAPLPIPAYQILAQAGEHVAKDVLICLVSHMGKAGQSVFPSYGTIQKKREIKRCHCRGYKPHGEVRLCPGYPETSPAN
jgi:hypothetical protein